MAERPTDQPPRNKFRGFIRVSILETRYRAISPEEIPPGCSGNKIPGMPSFSGKIPGIEFPGRFRRGNYAIEIASAK